MNTRVYGLASVALIFVFLAAGCGNSADDDNDNGQSNYDIPAEMTDLVTDDDLALLIDEGFDLNDGDNPPDIEGTYSANDSELTYDSTGEETGSPLFVYDWTFSNQSDGEMDVSYESRGSDEQASGVGGFIAGDDDCFTVAAEVEGVDGDCFYDRTHLVSGCIASNGIQGFQTAYVTVEPGGGPDADQQQCPPSDEVYRIADETDDLADRISN